jgi:hypothetical protein
VLLTLPLRLFGRSEAGTARHARGFLDRVYGLGNVPLANVWSNPVAIAVHRMPQIGEVSPGLWLASAFATHGLNTTAMAGELIARAITESDDHWRLFSPYGLVWAGGNAGKTAVFFSMAVGRLRDLALEEVSRLRAGPRRPAPAADVHPAEAIAVSDEQPVRPVADMETPPNSEPEAQNEAPPEPPDMPHIAVAEAAEANSGAPEPPQTLRGPPARRSRRKRRSVARRTERIERAP